MPAAIAMTRAPTPRHSANAAAGAISTPTRMASRNPSTTATASPTSAARPSGQRTGPSAGGDGPSGAGAASGSGRRYIISPSAISTQANPEAISSHSAAVWGANQNRTSWQPEVARQPLGERAVTQGAPSEFPLQLARQPRS